MCIKNVKGIHLLPLDSNISVTAHFLFQKVHMISMMTKASTFFLKKKYIGNIYYKSYKCK